MATVIINGAFVVANADGFQVVLPLNNSYCIKKLVNWLIARAELRRAFYG
jgi:hypothetical protein